MKKLITPFQQFSYRILNNEMTSTDLLIMVLLAFAIPAAFILIYGHYNGLILN